MSSREQSTKQQKISLALMISLVNVSKSTGNCGYVHIYQRNP